jgi:hypothetical protein
MPGTQMAPENQSGADIITFFVGFQPFTIIATKKKKKKNWASPRIRKWRVNSSPIRMTPFSLFQGTTNTPTSFVGSRNPPIKSRSSLVRGESSSHDSTPQIVFPHPMIAPHLRARSPGTRADHCNHDALAPLCKPRGSLPAVALPSPVLPSFGPC